MIPDKWAMREPQITDTLYAGALDWVSSIGLDEVLPAIFGDGKAAGYILDYRKARHIVCILDSTFDSKNDEDRSRLLVEAEAILGRGFEEYGYEIGKGNAAVFFENDTEVLN